MKNAIRKVFPDAHHRLCAWHLLRNANTNVKQLRFTKALAGCMLGDYEVSYFQRRWDKMVEECGVQDDEWVNDLYNRRETWAAAHMRGKFFAGFKTASRCEGLHSQLGRYVHVRNNLCEFLHHYKRALKFMRYQEVRSDFLDIFGEVVVQSPQPAIERSAARVFTKSVFLLFLPVIKRAAKYFVRECRETSSCRIYIINKTLCSPTREWHVAYYAPDQIFKCSCMRMESLGLPCEHIVTLMVFLSIGELPKSLIMDRWTKNIKESVYDRDEQAMGDKEAKMRFRVCGLEHRCREMCALAGEMDDGEFKDVAEKITTEVKRLQAKKLVQTKTIETAPDIDIDSLKNPAKVISKTSKQVGGKRKRVVKCSLCHQEGHSGTSCPGPNNNTSHVRNATFEEANMHQQYTTMEDGSEFGLPGGTLHIDICTQYE